MPGRTSIQNRNAGTSRIALGVVVFLCVLSREAHALVAWQTGATWMVSVNDLGVTGLSVSAGIVEADESPVAGFQYRVNPDPTNGWEGGFYFGNHFPGITFSFVDDGNPLNTNYSGHATGVGIHFFGRYNPAWGVSSFRGTALGCSTVTSYEANYFINNIIVPGTLTSNQVYSFAFTTDTSTTHDLSAAVDDYVEAFSKVFVQGVRSKATTEEFGGLHPAGMGVAYNIITVGRVSDLLYTNDGPSQFGPSWGLGTAKPDLLCGHISESTATGRGAGAALLLVDQANQSGWTNGSDPRVVKAIMMAGARKPPDWDKGNPGTDDDHCVPTDYGAGAGILHGLNDYGIMRGGEVAPGSVEQLPAWDLGSVAAGETNLYYLDIPQSNIFVSVTLAWYRHVTGPLKTVRDLNLRLYEAIGIAPGAELDWSTSTIDSVEHIWHELTHTGRVAIAVDGGRLSEGETYAVAWNLTGHTNAPLFDADLDGIDDAYENAQFGNIYLYGATDDPDGDTLDNFYEYIADTAPTSELSFLAADIGHSATNGGISVSFLSSTGRVYGVEYADGLLSTDSVWSAASSPPFPGNGGLTNWLDDGNGTGSPPSLTTSRVYRINVSLQ